ncbi:MAG: phosphodiester glycosidase family protein [Bacillota bacterium]|nr:phosphodiester glycosidase family protein [Bacillota bacterium]
MRYKLHIFILFVLAPFLGLGIAYGQLQPFSLNATKALSMPNGAFQEESAKISRQLYDLQESIWETRAAVETSHRLISLIRADAYAELEAYRQQHSHLQSLVEASAAQRHASGDMIDYVLANMLGDPVGQTFGANATIKVYSLEEVGYRGYMAKVRLHKTSALRMVLAGDQVGGPGETTSAAAKRSGAILAVNAGGFFAHEGGLLPIGITVVDGEILTFATHDTDLSFVGFNRSGQLVGGQVNTKEQLEAMGVLHGASFLPTLLKDGKKQSIPSAWKNTRHPRTLIGHFDNDDLLFIVIDGRREGWSMGVTLEEAQDKLLEFKVRDAYNLDGGGSSTFYYDGKVLNLPSGGAERRVTTNLVIIS